MGSDFFRGPGRGAADRVGWVRGESDKEVRGRFVSKGGIQTTTTTTIIIIMTITITIIIIIACFVRGCNARLPRV